MARLSGKVAIVTGGSQGMGAATAKLFVEQGAKVVIGDILDEKGQALADELGDNAIFARLDVSSEDNWKEVVAKTEEQFGVLNVLVNNAGILHVASLADTTPEDYLRVTHVNQLGPLLGMRAVIDPMKRAGVGSIINISSFEGFQAKNGLTAPLTFSSARLRTASSPVMIQVPRIKFE